MEDLWINIALSVLLSVVKNPAKALAIRSALIKLRDALILLNLGDKGQPAPQALVDAAGKAGQ